MKKLFLGLTATVILCCVFSFDNNDSLKTKSGKASGERWYIYYATWTEWGRTSRQCKGFGLCYYDDCWTCDVDDRPGKHKGIVVFDDETKKGNLFIELNPSESIELEAIKEKLPFIIDEDINNKNSILHQGTYAYDSKIGKHGGYRLDITIKN